MYRHEIDQRIKDLCEEIANERDTARVQELLKTLRETVESEKEETRLRMAFLANHYRKRLHALSHEEDNEFRPEQPVLEMKGVLRFLGLGSKLQFESKSES